MPSIRLLPICLLLAACAAETTPHEPYAYSPELGDVSLNGAGSFQVAAGSCAVVYATSDFLVAEGPAEIGDLVPVTADCMRWPARADDWQLVVSGDVMVRLGPADGCRCGSR